MTDDALAPAPGDARCHVAQANVARFNVAQFNVAQFNVATIRYPLDDPRMADFVAMLDPLNALADGTPGFVWRLVEEGEPDATRMRPAGADVIVNYSVWETTGALWDFVYRSPHLDTMRRRREWFQRHAELHSVMWWIPAGRTPTVEEALERLALLRADGPTPRAFTFSTSYTAAEAEAEARHAAHPAGG